MATDQCFSFGVAGKRMEKKISQAKILPFISMRIISEVKIAQSYPTLWDLMGYTVHGVLQARILEWVAFPFSRGKTRALFKKIRHTKGTFHAKMSTIKGRNSMDLIEAEDIKNIKKMWQEYMEEL